MESATTQTDNRPTLEIEVNNVNSRILYNPKLYNDYLIYCFKVIDNKLSFYLPNYENNADYNTILPDGSRKWDGKIHLFNPYPYTKYNLAPFEFSTGKIYEIITFLYQFGYKVKLIEKRVWHPKNQINWDWNEDYMPFDYQEEAAQAAVKEGRGIIQVGTGGGKCIASQSIIFLHNVGMIEIGQINNDNLSPKESEEKKLFVYTPLTKNKKDVSSHIYRDGESLSYEIYTSCGYNICGTPNHKIKIVNNNGNIDWKSLEDIKIGDYVVINKNQQIFGKDNDISLKDAYFYGLNINSINKTIPSSILRSKKEIIAAFIRGLYEKNGWIGKEKSKPTINIAISSKKLIDQLHVVLLNFGIISSKKLKHSTSVDSYILTIYKDFIPQFMNEIGLDQDYKETHKELFNLKNIEINSNKNLIPNQQNILRGIIDLLKKELGALNAKRIFDSSPIKKNTFRSWLNGKRTPSRNLFTVFNRWLKSLNYKSLDDHIKHIDFLTSDNFYYDKVKTKNQTISDNYDFVIPNSHSFVANGFINHNTNIGALIAQKLGVAPILFFVTTKELLEQAKDRFESLLGVEVGIIGDGECEIRDINICTIQTCFMAFGKEEEYRKQLKSLGGEFAPEEEGQLSEDKYEAIRQLVKGAKAVIFDEIHHAASDTCKTILELCENASYRYGLGATVQRDDGMEKVIEGLFGKYLCNISISFLIERGRALAPDIYIIPIETQLGLCENYQAEYKTYIVENQVRNDIISSIVADCVLAGKSTLCLVKFIPHGENLLQLIREKVKSGGGDPNKVDFLHGKIKKNKRKEIVKQMRDGEMLALVATSVADEGLDIPRLEILVLACGGKSKVKTIQRPGRVVRKFAGNPNKSPVVYDFKEPRQAKYLRKHSIIRKSIYETEPAFRVHDLTFKSITKNSWELFDS